MPAEQDIEKLESLVKQIEDYVSKGAWEPEQQEEILATIVQAEAIYDQIITEYIMKTDVPPVQQAYQVSELQERLHRSKHNLPSPPLRQEDKSKLIAGKEVALYTAPT